MNRGHLKLFLGWNDWGNDSRLPTSLPPPESALTMAFIVLQSESSVSLLETRWGFFPILFNLKRWWIQVFICRKQHLFSILLLMTCWVAANNKVVKQVRMDKWTIKKCKTLTILQNKADLISAVQSFVSSMDHIYTGAGQYTMKTNWISPGKADGPILHCLALRLVFYGDWRTGESERVCHIPRHKLTHKCQPFWLID